jgi:Ser/Thr protein kinase RdoA (MazF antagonist)
LNPKKFQRIHGDCHRGNLLQTDVPGQPKEFFLLDFDDFGMGPVVQDFWMLCLGDEEEAEKHLAALLRGYRELRDFDDDELKLLEPLRGLRIIHYAAWIARRWEDPSFPRLFPQFGTESYWLDELQSLEPIADNLV